MDFTLKHTANISQNYLCCPFLFNSLNNNTNNYYHYYYYYDYYHQYRRRHFRRCQNHTYSSEWVCSVLHFL